MPSAKYGRLPDELSMDEFPLRRGSFYRDSPHLRSGSSALSTPRLGKLSSPYSPPQQPYYQRREPPSGIVNKWIKNWWLYEVICAIFGLALMVALVVMLNRFDGQESPKLGTIFGASISLNAIVSILAGLSKAALLCTVAECLGQLKWIWYSKRHRQLHDLEIFDRASRGSYGAFEIIWAVNFRQIATIGGVLTILALFVDPLAQQLVEYHNEIQHTPSSSAAVLAQNLWREASTDVRTFGNPQGLDYISPTTKGAVQAGIYQGNTTIPDATPRCDSTSGDCTYPTYQSLAVCQSWTDISQHVTFTNLTKQYFDRADFYNLTADHHVLNANGTSYFNISSVAPSNLTDQPHQPLNFSLSWAYPDTQNAIADVFVMYYNGSTSTPDKPAYSAIEFVLEWCVQTFNTTYANGIPNTTRYDDQRGFKSSDPNSDLHLQVGSTDYTVDLPTHYSLQRYFFSVFGARLFTSGTWSQDPSSWVWFSDTDVVQSLFEPFNVFQQQHASANSGQGTNQTGFDTILKNIATSMTNHVRTTNPSDTLTGQSDRLVTVVHVQWGWFAGPAAYTVASLLFLAATMAYQAAGPTARGSWKTSSLAVLHAANPELQQMLQGMKYTSEMDDQAEATHVQLLNQAEGEWQLCPKRLGC